MAWKETKEVGCGLSKAPTMNKDTMLVVCNYWPMYGAFFGLRERDLF